MASDNNAIGAPIPFSLANGGTGAALTAVDGAIAYSTASAIAFSAATTTANQVLLSANFTTPVWSTAVYPAATTINQILYSSTNNNITGLATADSAVLITSTGGFPQWAGPLTNGEFIIGATGSIPLIGGIAAGTNIEVLNGPGMITISATGIDSFVWNNITANTVAMVADNGYILQSLSTTTCTLPATAAIGTLISICGVGNGWTIVYGTGQFIIVGSLETTTTTTGSLSSSSGTDQVDLLCVATNTAWIVRNIPTSAYTIV